MGTTSLRATTAAEVRAEMARQRRSGVELATHLDLSQQAVSRRLAGEVAFDLDELAAVAEWLGVPLQTLIAPRGVA